MKKWSVLLAACLVVLSVIAAPVAVMAETNEVTTTDAATQELRFRGGLALVAPRVVGAGTEMSMLVLTRSNQQPVEDVGVWAASKDSVETLKTEVQTLQKDTSIPAVAKDYTAVISAHAILLGHTDANGKLTHTFPEPEKYLLISFKKGYYPDWSALNVVNLPKALAIHSPLVARINNEVTISVNQRGTQDPVENATVWAVDKDRVEELKAQVQAFKANSNTPAADQDYESVVSVIAARLGRTDANGKLVHTFTEADRYLLVTLKKGYIPGFTPIGIRAPAPTTTAATTPASK